MTKFGILGSAAIILASTLAGPAMAQQASDNAGKTYQHHAAYRHSADRDRTDRNQNDERRDNSGFWPADVAAGVVGGAVGTAGAVVGTAGAIATAPFRGDAYASGNGYNNGWDNRTYAQRNGFVCQPGTWFKGEDGRRHICQ